MMIRSSSDRRSFSRQSNCFEHKNEKNCEKKDEQLKRENENDSIVRVDLFADWAIIKLKLQIYI